MNRKEFKKKLEEIFKGIDDDPLKTHLVADKLMIMTLESNGYDLTVFKKAAEGGEIWYS